VVLSFITENHVKIAIEPFAVQTLENASGVTLMNLTGIKMIELTSKELIDLIKSLSKIEGLLIADNYNPEKIDGLLSNPMRILDAKINNIIQCENPKEVEK